MDTTRPRRPRRSCMRSRCTTCSIWTASRKVVEVCRSRYLATRARFGAVEHRFQDNIVHKAIARSACLQARPLGKRIDFCAHRKAHSPRGGVRRGSSDAAAALVGAAKLWGVDADAPEIREAAYELGADVAFFLHGGCACLTGAGEVFTIRSIP